jgi:hypothetical protein
VPSGAIVNVAGRRTWVAGGSGLDGFVCVWTWIPPVEVVEGVDDGRVVAVDVAPGVLVTPPAVGEWLLAWLDPPQPASSSTGRNRRNDSRLLTLPA